MRNHIKFVAALLFTIVVLWFIVDLYGIRCCFKDDADMRSGQYDRVRSILDDVRR